MQAILGISAARLDMLERWDEAFPPAQRNGDTETVFSASDMERYRVRIANAQSVVDGAVTTPDAELAFTLPTMAQRLHVSWKTLDRWSTHEEPPLRGTVARVRGNICRVLTDRHVQAFREAHPEVVSYAQSFSRMTDIERCSIIQLAEQLVQKGCPTILGLLSTLAKRAGRNHETVRSILHDCRNDHPVIDQFMKQTAMKDQRERTLVEQAQELSLGFIPNDCFGKAERHPKLAQNILAPMPTGNDRNRSKAVKPPKGLDEPYLRELYNHPLLTHEQEAHLFRKMNYLKFRAHGLQKKLVELQQKRGKDTEQTALAKEILELKTQSEHVRNAIIQANLRLVVSIAKRYTGPDQGLHALVSDGNDSLMRAVERFDFSRGYKFSTYATWAIVKNFSRTIPNEQRVRARYFSVYQEDFSFCADHRADLSEQVDLKHCETTSRNAVPLSQCP